MVMFSLPSQLPPLTVTALKQHRHETPLGEDVGFRNLSESCKDQKTCCASKEEAEAQGCAEKTAQKGEERG